ncbi:MAG: PAS domain S-box protein [Halanaerobiales bacterium]|nr:PAS domain S-box protein [Halanaerobiales bacterium]
MNQLKTNEILIPSDIKKKWQDLVNIIAELLDIPAALIMRADPPYIEVFKSSDSDGNPYQIGDREKLTGLYCETVIKKNQMLLIPNASKDEKWKDNPDIELGMISYLGFPLKWPDDKIFGTVCILDSKENGYKGQEEKLLTSMKDIIESYLKIIFQNKELKNKEKRLNITLYSIGDGVITTDNDAKITKMNNTAEELTGWKIKEAKGKKLKDIFKIKNTKNDKLIKDPVQKVLKEGETIGLANDTTLVSKDGTEKQIVDSAAPIKNDRGEILGVILVFSDITEKYRARQKLKESEKRFRNLFNTMLEGCQIINFDWEYLYVNNAFCKQINLEKTDIVGKKIYNVFPEIKDTEIFELLKESMNERVIKEKNYKIDLFDGSKKWFHIISRPVDEGIFILSTDITESIKYKKELIKAKDRLENFFSISTDLLFISDLEGNIIKANKAWQSVLGFSKEEIIGHHYKEFIHPDDIKKTRKSIKKLEKNHKNVVNLNRYKTKEGSYRHFEWYSNSDGKYLYGAGRDITDKIETQNKIKRENKWLNSLYNNSSDPIAILDDKHQVVDINQAFEKLFKFSIEEIKGRDLDQVMNMSKKDSADKSLTNKLLKGEYVEIEDTRYDRDGNPIECIIKGIPVNIDGEFLGGYAIYNDITERKNREEQIKQLSFHDSLTGLYNRAYFEEEIKRLDVKRQLPIVLIMADLNGLKLINDTYGHNVGDIFLQKTAEVLKNTFRKEDIIARWGGDQIVILLNNTSKEKALKLYQRIKNIDQRVSIGDEKEIPISIAVGYSIKDSSKIEIQNLFKISEDMMYKDKLLESESTKSQIVEILLQTLQEKSHETKEHAERLEILAKKLGDRTKLDISEKNRLSLLARLHDIGKTVISEEILNKAGKLNKAEWEKIKTHPSIGYRICSEIEDFSHIAQEVLSHHEHWNGQGYPRKLKGNKIPLLSRIISIVDAYDVMTTGRIYKKAISKAEALKEIKRKSGSQFDPVFSEHFIKMMKENKI